MRHVTDRIGLSPVVERAVELLSFRLRRLGHRFAWSALPARQFASGGSQ